MKQLFKRKNSITKVGILLLASSLLSAYVVYSLFYHFTFLLWLAMTLTVAVLAYWVIDLLDWLIVKLFKIRIHIVVLIILLVVFYYYLLRYKTYRMPYEAKNIIIALMTFVTMCFFLSLDIKHRHSRKITVLSLVLLMIFYSFQLGQGFALDNHMPPLEPVEQSLMNLEDDEVSDFEIIDIEGPSIDLSSWVSDTEEANYELREKIHGFDYDEVPIRGRLYLPEGSGDFPLLAIIHGNHKMVTPSYLGYEYLGKYLASRNIAMVSFDQAMLNGYVDDDLDNDNPARAVLLLEGLKFLQEETDYPLSFDNLVLAGHSRGGEAITIASVFNTLERDPKNSQYEFDYDFDIESLLAISATHNQYSLSRYPTDVNYVAIHGAHDQDVRSFRAQLAYDKIKVDDEHFKSNLYVAQANHGQFNSEWGRYDTKIPRAFNTNVRNLMTANQQQQILSSLAYQLVRVSHDTQASIEPFTNIHAFSSQLPDVWMTQQHHVGQAKLIHDFREEETVLYTRDKNQSRLNKVKEIEGIEGESVTFEIKEEGSLLSFDILGYDTTLDMTIMVEATDGDVLIKHISELGVVTPPYPIYLSKWEVIFNEIEYSHMMETIEIATEYDEIESISIFFNSNHKIVIDNIYIQ